MNNIYFRNVWGRIKCKECQDSTGTLNFTPLQSCTSTLHRSSHRLYFSPFLNMLLWEFPVHFLQSLSFIVLTFQGASAGGFPCLVCHTCGASDLQSVPGPDSWSPTAVHPRWRHQGPQPWISSAAATAGRVKHPADTNFLIGRFACETNTHSS